MAHHREMTDFAFPPPPKPSVPVRGQTGRFPVHRIYCVGRNYAEHAREMGLSVDRGEPVFFTKPPDAVLPGGGASPYPRATAELHHEVELVVALGPGGGGELEGEEALERVFGYAVGLDLTRRDRQRVARERGLPWDTAKAFDRSAPISAIVPASEWRPEPAHSVWLEVNGALRQSGRLGDMIFDVAEVVSALSRLFELSAGDLIFMGTPAGVGPLEPGDRYRAGVDGLATLEGEITSP